MGLFRRHNAHPKLQRYIQGYWMIEAGEEGLSLQLIPDGFPEIYIFRSGGFSGGQPRIGLVGQFNQRFSSSLLPYSQMISVKLYPWTPAALFGPIQSQLQNLFIPLFQVDEGNNLFSVLNQCTEKDSLKEMASILDQFFLKNYENLSKANPFLEFAARRVFQNYGVIDFDQICSTVNASRRYLELKFKEEIGLSPRQYARVIRVKKASLEILAKDESQTFRDIAFSLGYYDSSHFRKDFRSIVGETPTGFLLKQHSEIETIPDYLKQWEYSK